MWKRCKNQCPLWWNKTWRHKSPKWSSKCGSIPQSERQSGVTDHVSPNFLATFLPVFVGECRLKVWNIPCWARQSLKIYTWLDASPGDTTLVGSDKEPRLLSCQPRRSGCLNCFMTDQDHTRMFVHKPRENLAKGTKVWPFGVSATQVCGRRGLAMVVGKYLQSGAYLLWIYQQWEWMRKQIFQNEWKTLLFWQCCEFEQAEFAGWGCGVVFENTAGRLNAVNGSEIWETQASLDLWVWMRLTLVSLPLRPVMPLMSTSFSQMSALSASAVRLFGGDGD